MSHNVSWSLDLRSSILNLRTVQKEETHPCPFSPESRVNIPQARDLPQWPPGLPESPGFLLSHKQEDDNGKTNTTEVINCPKLVKYLSDLFYLSGIQIISRFSMLEAEYDLIL